MLKHTNMDTHMDTSHTSAHALIHAYTHVQDEQLGSLREDLDRVLDKLSSKEMEIMGLRDSNSRIAGLEKTIKEQEASIGKMAVEIAKGKREGRRVGEGGGSLLACYHLLL